MSGNKSAGEIVYICIIYFLLILISVITLFPFANVLAQSFSDKFNVSMGRVILVPKGFNLDSYAVIASNPVIWRSYAYTILYTVTGTFLTLLLTAMMAYPLVIKTYILRNIITILLVITMFFGGGLIPYYLLIRKLHMINTLWVMIVPGSISAWNVFVYRTFFKGIPDSLRESAILDGANDFTVLWRIVIPLSKALFATMGLFSIVGNWNSFFSALMFLTDSKKYPLQMILRRILNEVLNDDMNLKGAIVKKNMSPINIQSAAIIFTSLPIICIYPFLQKYFAKGVLIGSIKG